MQTRLLRKKMTFSVALLNIYSCKIGLLCLFFFFFFVEQLQWKRSDEEGISSNLKNGKKSSRLKLSYVKRERMTSLSFCFLSR
jgi:hypothetical protein